MIAHIYDDREKYEVGKCGITSIELTNHGNKKTTIYKVEYESKHSLYVGLLEHEVIRRE